MVQEHLFCTSGDLILFLVLSQWLWFRKTNRQLHVSSFQFDGLNRGRGVMCSFPSVLADLQQRKVTLPGEVRAWWGFTLHLDSKKLLLSLWNHHWAVAASSISVMVCISVLELQSIAWGTNISAGNTDLHWAGWIWALLFQVFVEEVVPVCRSGECSNFPIRFWRLKLFRVMLKILFEDLNG